MLNNLRLKYLLYILSLFTLWCWAKKQMTIDPYNDMNSLYIGVLTKEKVEKAKLNLLWTRLLAVNWVGNKRKCHIAFVQQR